MRHHTFIKNISNKNTFKHISNHCYFTVISNPNVGTLPPDDTWRAPPIRTSSGRSTRHSQTSHPDDSISYSDMLSGSSDSLPQPTCRHLQSERIEMMANHIPRSLTAARRVMMTLPPLRGIMTSQKVSLPLKKEAELLILYIRTFTQGGR